MHPRQTYPLAALFVLTAVCCVLASLLTFQFRHGEQNGVGANETIQGVLGGAFVTMLLGMVVGLFQRRPFIGVLWGGITGVVVGACAGPLAFLRAADLPALLGTIWMGSVLLVGAGVVIRYWSRPERRE